MSETGFLQQILTRSTHSQNIWDQHLLYSLTGNLLNVAPSPITQFVLVAYENTIPLDPGKRKDLKKLMEFLSGNSLTFYQNFLAELDAHNELI